jgi:hypothetical protein
LTTRATRQNVLFCGFHPDRKLTTEAAQNGGYFAQVREDSVALRDDLPGRATRSAGWVRRLPRDQVDHTIWALSRGVISSDRPSAAEQQASGIRSSVPPILPACPSDSAASSLTLTICLAGLAWPGLAQAFGWKILPERENEIVAGTDQNAPVGT